MADPGELLKEDLVEWEKLKTQLLQSISLLKGFAQRTTETSSTVDSLYLEKVDAASRKLNLLKPSLGLIFNGKDATIDGIKLESAAAGAGLQRGDILRQINDTPTATPNDVVNFLRSCKAGQQLKLLISRGTDLLSIPVALQAQNCSVAELEDALEWGNRNIVPRAAMAHNMLNTLTRDFKLLQERMEELESNYVGHLATRDRIPPPWPASSPNYSRSSSMQSLEQKSAYGSVATSPQLPKSNSYYNSSNTSNNSNSYSSNVRSANHCYSNANDTMWLPTPTDTSQVIRPRTSARIYNYYREQLQHLYAADSVSSESEEEWETAVSSPPSVSNANSLTNSPAITPLVSPLPPTGFSGISTTAPSHTQYDQASSPPSTSSLAPTPHPADAKPGDSAPKTNRIPIGVSHRLIDYFIALKVNPTKDDFSSRRYPLQDHVDCPLPSIHTIARFALAIRPYRVPRVTRPTEKFKVVVEDVSPSRPRVIRTEEKPEDPEIPLYFSLRLTDPLGDRVYVGCVHYYLATSPDQYTAHCLCLLSHYPLAQFMRACVQELYAVANRLVDPGIPCPEQMLQLLLELPLPYPAASPVSCIFGSTPLTVSVPSPTQLPLLDIDVRDLLENVNAQTLINLFVSLLTEQRVLLFCASWQVLFSVAEILQSLIFPFRSYQVYVPVVPNSMVDMSDAPVPFLLGFYTDAQEKISDESIENAVVVELSKNENERRVKFPGDLPTLPYDMRKYLEQQFHTALSLPHTVSVSVQGKLSRLYGTDSEALLCIRMAFFFVMGRLFSNYDRCLFMLPGGVPYFDASSFLKIGKMVTLAPTKTVYTQKSSYSSSTALSSLPPSSSSSLPPSSSSSTLVKPFKKKNWSIKKLKSVFSPSRSTPDEAAVVDIVVKTQLFSCFLEDFEQRNFFDYWFPSVTEHTSMLPDLKALGPKDNPPPPFVVPVPIPYHPYYAYLFDRDVINQSGLVLKPLQARIEMYEMLRQMGGQVFREVRECKTWLGLKCSKKKQGRLTAKTVDPDGPCAQAGIMVGDTIVEVCGREMLTIEEFGNVLRDRQVGDICPIRVERDGASYLFQVEVRSKDLNRDTLNDSCWLKIYQALENLEQKVTTSHDSPASEFASLAFANLPKFYGFPHLMSPQRAILPVCDLLTKSKEQSHITPQQVEKPYLAFVASLNRAANASINGNSGSNTPSFTLLAPSGLSISPLQPPHTSNYNSPATSPAFSSNPPPSSSPSFTPSSSTTQSLKTLLLPSVSSSALLKSPLKTGWSSSKSMISGLIPWKSSASSSSGGRYPDPNSTFSTPSALIAPSGVASIGPSPPPSPHEPSSGMAYANEREDSLQHEYSTADRGTSGMEDLTITVDPSARHGSNSFPPLTPPSSDSNNSVAHDDQQAQTAEQAAHLSNGGGSAEFREHVSAEEDTQNSYRPSKNTTVIHFTEPADSSSTWAQPVPDAGASLEVGEHVNESNYSNQPNSDRVDNDEDKSAASEKEVVEGSSHVFVVTEGGPCGQCEATLMPEHQEQQRHSNEDDHIDAASLDSAVSQASISAGSNPFDAPRSEQVQPPVDNSTTVALPASSAPVVSATKPHSGVHMVVNPHHNFLVVDEVKTPTPVVSAIVPSATASSVVVSSSVPIKVNTIDNDHLNIPFGAMTSRQKKIRRTTKHLRRYLYTQLPEQSKMSSEQRLLHSMFERFRGCIRERTPTAPLPPTPSINAPPLLPDPLAVPLQQSFHSDSLLPLAVPSAPPPTPASEHLVPSSSPSIPLMPSFPETVIEGTLRSSSSTLPPSGSSSPAPVFSSHLFSDASCDSSSASSLAINSMSAPANSSSAAGVDAPSLADTSPSSFSVFTSHLTTDTTSPPIASSAFPTPASSPTAASLRASLVSSNIGTTGAAANTSSNISPFISLTVTPPSPSAVAYLSSLLLPSTAPIPSPAPTLARTPDHQRQLLRCTKAMRLSTCRQLVCTLLEEGITGQVSSGSSDRTEQPVVRETYKELVCVLPPAEFEDLQALVLTLLDCCLDTSDFMHAVGPLRCGHQYVLADAPQLTLERVIMHHPIFKNIQFWAMLHRYEVIREQQKYGAGKDDEGLTKRLELERLSLVMHTMLTYGMHLDLVLQFVRETTAAIGITGEEAECREILAQNMWDSLKQPGNL